VCFSSGNVGCAVDAYGPSVVLCVITVIITISIIINIFFFFLTVIIQLLLKDFQKKSHSKLRLFPEQGISDVTEVLFL
jgi:hypothetical protein